MQHKGEQICRVKSRAEARVGTSTSKQAGKAEDPNLKTSNACIDIEQHTDSVLYQRGAWCFLIGESYQKRGSVSPRTFRTMVQVFRAHVLSTENRGIKQSRDTLLR